MQLFGYLLSSDQIDSFHIEGMSPHRIGSQVHKWIWYAKHCAWWRKLFSLIFPFMWCPHQVELDWGGLWVLGTYYLADFGDPRDLDICDCDRPIRASPDLINCDRPIRVVSTDLSHSCQRVKKRPSQHPNCELRAPKIIHRLLRGLPQPSHYLSAQPIIFKWWGDNAVSFKPLLIHN